MAGLACAPAHGGPPYVADDPEPTEFRHYEIYFFGTGQEARSGRSGAWGVDFNYGGAPDLQLTAVLPIAYQTPAGEDRAAGPGNLELAAKYRWLHQRTAGWDVALFPRLFLPSLSNRVGERHTQFFLPVWVERDWGSWSTFGGGGYTLNRGSESRDFYLAAWALTYRLLPPLQIGTELYHQSADSEGGRASTGIGLGATYDANDHLHLMAYGAPGVQNAAETGRYLWYAAVLLTF